MAFMMPVVRKNYNIYGDRSRNPSGPEGGPVRKTSQGSSLGSSNIGGSRRRVRSEGPSLSTSPKHSQADVIHRIPIPRNNSTNGHPPVSMARSVPVSMRTGRGSAPVLGNGQVLYVRHNSLPEGPSSVPVKVPLSPTNSTGSSTSSSDDHPHQYRFHIKLLNRLKKSFRTKDPAPAAS